MKGLVADLMYFFAKKYYFSNVPRVSAIFFVKKHVQKGKYLRVTPFGMLHDSLPHCARLGRNTSDKIQALEYKPWFQRIKDYLFGLAAVSMILLFVNALQSKIQMLKQTRENAKKLKQMQNKEEDDYPSI